MGGIFYACSSLTSLDLSGWDVSNVTDMDDMFNDCSSLTSLDLSGWNTSRVTNMNGMFSGCRSLTTLDLSGWDVSNVTGGMFRLFYCCYSLTTLDLSGWDVSKFRTMSNMFGYCPKLKTIRMKGCSSATVDKIKAQLATDGITGCTIVTE